MELLALLLLAFCLGRRSASTTKKPSDPATPPASGRVRTEGKQP